MHFLDVNIIREQGKFITSVYCKPTFSGIFSFSLLMEWNLLLQESPDLNRN